MFQILTTGRPNRAAVLLRVLGERAGVSVAELSSASGVARPTLYDLLWAREQRGEITKEQLPGGSTGDRLVPAGVRAEPLGVVTCSGPTIDVRAPALRGSEHGKAIGAVEHSMLVAEALAHAVTTRGRARRTWGRDGRRLKPRPPARGPGP